MKILRQIFKFISYESNDSLAYGTWKPHPNETKAILEKGHIDSIDRVDQIWPWLSKNYGQITAVDAPYGEEHQKYTYQEMEELIAKVAGAFKNYEIDEGDVVAIFAENSPKWMLVDQGIMRIGAADAVRGSTAPIEELKYILEDSKAVALVAQSADLIDKLAINELQTQRIKLIVQLEGDAKDGVLDWKSFLKKGTGAFECNSFLDRGVESSESITATILYTSGTTGKPKGVPLTHANLLHQIRSLVCVANPSAGSKVLSVLPIWHAYERSAEYYFFSCGCTQFYTNIKNLKNDLPRVQPMVMATVPRLWEAIKNGFDDVVNQMPFLRKLLIKAALKNSGSYKLSLRKSKALLIEELSLHRRIFALLDVSIRWPIHLLASRFIWPKVLNQLCGGKLKFPINGGGAIAPHVDQFFESLGVELLVGYGLTETSPVVSCRRPWKNIRGSSGTALPETEFRIVDPTNFSLLKFRERGLVLVRGPQVMKGYLGKPEATNKVLDDNGWFNTGDLGMLLPDGSLVLTGRAKDTIVLSNGENIEPGPLEEVLLGSSMIQQVMLVGQDEKSLGALVVPNMEMMRIWAKSLNISITDDFLGVPENENLRKSLRRQINSLLRNRPGSRQDERVIGVAFVEPFTLENGLLTQTLKQRREKILVRDQLLIKKIYSK